MSSSDHARLDDKRALRRSLAERRRALSPQIRARCAAEVSRRLLALPEMARAHVIAGFAALPAELDPAAALAAARMRGAAVVYPRVTAESPRLAFHRVDDPSSLTVGAFGVREPAAASPRVGLGEIDLWLVPGLAFDDGGRRLGYGGGFYDEAIAGARAAGKAVFVGVAFDFQVIARCPVDPHDADVDAVVTDVRVIRRALAAPVSSEEMSS